MAVRAVATIGFGVVVAFGALLSVPPSTAQVPVEHVLLGRIEKPSTGDLGRIKKRRLIRVLVSHSRTNFFFDRGVPRGFEYEMLRKYEKYLNRSITRPDRKIKMAFVPLPFERLLGALREGRGDIVAAGLTITPEREKLVAFTRPYLADVSEVVVLSRSLDGIRSVEDLAGRTVHVRRGTSYVGHLAALNDRLRRAGKRRIEVVEADPHLATEDILELVNAGVVKITVADRHIAEAWGKVLTKIVVRGDLEINTGGRIAWAVRKKNPELLASLDGFVKQVKAGSLLGNVLFRRYYRESKWIKNPLSAAERRKLDKLIALFRKYADRYEFDWLAIAAQAYQESGLDHDKRSRAGAVGIMQVLPRTAAEPPISIRNIHRVENNIHAGVKYLRLLRDRYFDEPGIEPAARVDFAWAAYNAGPTRITVLRREAGRRGFDPNQWFGHVEALAAQRIGRETVDYVANINKYYVAYKLVEQSLQEKGGSRPAQGNEVTRGASQATVRHLEAPGRTVVRAPERTVVGAPGRAARPPRMEVRHLRRR